MNIFQIVPGAYRISFGMVSAFLIDDGGLTLIDSGLPGCAPAILEAIESLGKKPGDVGNILFTHFHEDHTGSARALKEATGATLHMNRLDADSFEKGEAMRPIESSPGLLNRLVVAALTKGRPRSSIETVKIDRDLEDGAVLPFAGNLRAIASPGHTAGHFAFLWPREGGVLFLGDAAGAMVRLGFSPIYENFGEGKRSLAKLAELEFETACPSHGKPIQGGASAVFKKKWAGLEQVL
jgi:glyoxylase-like metal-dependent hydrolase (beta-lactamase superfamily II)